MPRSLFCLGVCVLALLGCAQPVNPKLAAPVQESATAEAAAGEKAPSVISSPAPSSEASPLVKIRSRPTLDERLLFQPAEASRGNYRPEGLEFEDVSFRSADGTALHGWYCPCENPRAHILFAHGNAGNLSFWSQRMRELQQDHCVCVFIFDYRGYGKSAGKPTVPGVLQDARAAARVFAKMAGIKESEIVVMGQSLGGAVAVHLAAEIQPRGLILESTFSSFRDVADHHAKWASWLVPKEKLNSIGQIGEYRGPLLQCHGNADRVVPFALGQKLFHSANEPKTFVTLKGGDHNSPLPRTYRWQLDDFFQELCQNSSPEKAAGF